MTDAPIYQIAFMFVFNQDLANQKAQIGMTDGNTFLVSDSRTAQLQSYVDNATPPLLAFSVSGTQMFFNVSEGKAHAGMQGVAWSTFTAGSPPTLELDVQFSGGLITATYAVIGTGVGGQFTPGRNTITLAR